MMIDLHEVFETSNDGRLWQEVENYWFQRTTIYMESCHNDRCQYVKVNERRKDLKKKKQKMFFHKDRFIDHFFLLYLKSFGIPGKKIETTIFDQDTTLIRSNYPNFFLTLPAELDSVTDWLIQIKLTNTEGKMQSNVFGLPEPAIFQS